MPTQDLSMFNNALMAPASPMDAVNKVTGMQNALIENQVKQATAPIAVNNAKLDQAQKHMEFMSSMLTPLIALGDKVTAADVARAASNGVSISGGAVAPAEATQWLTNITTHPQGIPAALQQAALAVQDVNSRIATMRGNTIATGTGGGTQFSQQNGFNGAMTPTQGGYIPNTLSPGEKTNPVTVYQNGQKGMVPAGAMYDDFGRLRTGASAPAAGPAVVSPPTAPAAGTAQAAMAPRGFIPTEPPIGVAEATNRTAAQSAEQGGSLQTMADAAPTRKGILTNLEGDLKNFNSGPVADLINQGKATFNQVGQIVGLPAGAQFDQQSIASQENFRKQATMLQQQQSQALGGTDASLASAGHSNPNTAFSKLGNEQVIQVLKGNEDAINAKNSAWQKWKQTHGPDTFGAFQEDFNKGYDPRAFQFPYMSPEQRQKVLADLPNNDQRAAFKQKVIDAVNKGFIKPPGAQ